VDFLAVHFVGDGEGDCFCDGGVGKEDSVYFYWGDFFSSELIALVPCFKSGFFLRRGICGCGEECACND